MKNLLDVGVGADDVLYLIRVWVLEGEAAGPDQHPLPVLHSETIHYGQNLTLQLHHLQRRENTVSNMYSLSSWVYSESSMTIST